MRQMPVRMVIRQLALWVALTCAGLQTLPVAAGDLAPRSQRFKAVFEAVRLRDKLFDEGFKVTDKVSVQATATVYDPPLRVRDMRVAEAMDAVTCSADPDRLLARQPHQHGRQDRDLLVADRARKPPPADATARRVPQEP